MTWESILSTLKGSLHPFPVAARAKGVQGQGHRIGHWQKKILEQLGGRIWELRPERGLDPVLCAAGKSREMMESIGPDGAGIEVLRVEDSPGDVRFTREAFTLLSCSHALQCAEQPPLQDVLEWWISS